MVQILGKSIKNWASNCSLKIWSQNSAKCGVAKSHAKDSNVSGEWHDLQVLLKNACYILISTILHYICHPSQWICYNTEMWPFIKNALWAIDGSCIPCMPPTIKCGSYQNWKGSMSQNCLFICSFNLWFLFGYTGWEGSVANGQVWEATLDCRLEIPDGHYYLADARYPGNDPQLLIPYRGIPYHLAEWSWASQRWAIDEY